MAHPFTRLAARLHERVTAEVFIGTPWRLAVAEQLSLDAALYLGNQWQQPAPGRSGAFIATRLDNTST